MGVGTNIEIMIGFGTKSVAPMMEKVEPKKAMTSAKFLDFDKEKVQVLTLDQLRRTHKENNIDGKPMREMYHFQLLDSLMEQADKRNMKLEIYDLFAAHNRDKNQPGVSLLPQVEEKFGKQAVEAHILRRVYANIRIKDYDDKTYTTNLAVAFHQKGVQMALGNNVKICHNQMMLGNKDFYAATYSDRGRTKDQPSVTMFPEIFSQWLDSAEESIMGERKRIERMKQVILKPEQIFMMLGMLHCMRVQHDTDKKAIRNSSVYPLTQTQLNTFTESLMVKNQQKGEVSLWDVYDSATDLYKGNSMEIPQVLPQNSAMAVFLEENYSI